MKTTHILAATLILVLCSCSNGTGEADNKKTIDSLNAEISRQNHSLIEDSLFAFSSSNIDSAALPKVKQDLVFRRNKITEMQNQIQSMQLAK